MGGTISWPIFGCGLGYNFFFRFYFVSLVYSLKRLSTPSIFTILRNWISLDSQDSLP